MQWLPNTRKRSLVSRRMFGELGLVLAIGLGICRWLQAAPTVEQMLTFQPRQRGVAISTPTQAEYPQCKVELVQGTSPGSTGWALRDPQGRFLRRFMDTNGDRYPDQWCYYKDGVEVYREVDSNFNGKVDRYYWLNTAGMKIGLDRDEDGTIDDWLALSPEELSQLAAQALATRGLPFISDAPGERGRPAGFGIAHARGRTHPRTT
jgi:hypothetical protein